MYEYLRRGVSEESETEDAGIIVGESSVYQKSSSVSIRTGVWSHDDCLA